MKNYLTSTLLLFSILFFSCNKEKDEQLKPQPTKCWLIESQSGTNNVKYFYDAKQRIERVVGTHGSKINIQTYEFDSNDNMIKVSTLDTAGIVNSYTTYEYNNQGKLSKQTFYLKQASGYVPYTTTLFKYDSNNVLERSERSNSNGTPSYYDTYTYGNQTLVIQSFDPSGNLQSTSEYEFDTMKSATSQGGGSGSISIFPPNNILKYTIKDASGNIGVYSSTNTYHYNSQGYPSQVTITYSGRPTETITYTYSCQ